MNISIRRNRENVSINNEFIQEGKRNKKRGKNV